MNPEVIPICPDCGEKLYRAMWENEHGLAESEVRCAGCETPRTARFETVFVDGPDDTGPADEGSDRAPGPRSPPLRADD